ncbi:hypothetical protein BIY28_03290 [Brenneria goodwinii]|nr:hypothetical protein BIY28_03290 [Brenneria goodwinii]
MCGPDSTHNEASTLKHRFFVITITKTKRFFMGALVGAPFGRFSNKTNNKQHVNRGYDPESDLSFFMLPYKSLYVFNSISWRENLFRCVLIYPFVSGKIGVVKFDKWSGPHMALNNSKIALQKPALAQLMNPLMTRTCMT